VKTKFTTVCKERGSRHQIPAYCQYLCATVHDSKSQRQ